MECFLETHTLFITPARGLSSPIPNSYINGHVPPLSILDWRNSIPISALILVDALRSNRRHWEIPRNLLVCCESVVSLISIYWQISWLDGSLLRRMMRNVTRVSIGHLLVVMCAFLSIRWVLYERRDRRISLQRQRCPRWSWSVRAARVFQLSFIGWRVALSLQNN